MYSCQIGLEKIMNEVILGNRYLLIYRKPIRKQEF